MIGGHTAKALEITARTSRSPRAGGAEDRAYDRGNFVIGPYEVVRTAGIGDLLSIIGAIGRPIHYVVGMAAPLPLPDDDDVEAEAHALAAAIAESDADPRTVPHEEVRAWLLRIAEGDFEVPPPEPR